VPSGDGEGGVVSSSLYKIGLDRFGWDKRNTSADDVDEKVAVTV